MHFTFISMHGDYLKEKIDEKDSLYKNFL